MINHHLVREFSHKLPEGNHFFHPNIAFMTSLTSPPQRRGMQSWTSLTPRRQISHMYSLYILYILSHRCTVYVWYAIIIYICIGISYTVCRNILVTTYSVSIHYHIGLLSENGRFLPQNGTSTKKSMTNIDKPICTHQTGKPDLELLEFVWTSLPM